MTSTGAGLGAGRGQIASAVYDPDAVTLQEYRRLRAAPPPPPPAAPTVPRPPAGRCTVDGCPRPVHARGWCANHYRRHRLYGDPLATAADVPASVPSRPPAAPAPLAPQETP